MIRASTGTVSRFQHPSGWCILLQTVNMIKPSSYGWVVVTSAFFITYITCGINFSFGVFMLPIITEMGWSRGLISSVMVVVGIIYAFTLPATGSLSERYGYKWVLGISTSLLGAGLLLSSQIHELWQLYVYNGLFIGLSAAATYAVPVALVALWFRERQGLALGVATLGVSLGTATVPLIISWIIGICGWRTAMLIAGTAVIGITLPAVLLIRQPPLLSRQPVNNSADTGVPSENAWHGLTPREAVRTGHFWLLFIILLIFLTGLNLLMLHLVPYAVDSGMTPVQAASLLTLIGLCGIAGRLGAGVVSDRYGAKPVMVGGLCLLTLIVLMVTLFPRAWSFYLFAALYGVGYSSVATMMVRITRYVFGVKALGPIFSLLMISDGIGVAVGPVLAGLMFDITGSYFSIFLMVSAALAGAAVATATLRPTRQT